MHNLPTHCLSPRPTSHSVPCSSGTLFQFVWLRPGRAALLALSVAVLGWAMGAEGADPVQASEQGTATPPGAKTVKVTARKEGEVTHFYVENNEYCEITMTFEPAIVHLTSDKQLPYTATFPPHQTTKAFTLTPSEPGAKWEYSYTNYYKLGSNLARHDDAYVYQLPYAPGDKFRVTQGYNGKFSHTGSNQYATDWKMPEGTPVYAARGGVVAKLKDDSDKGGSSMKYDPYNNYVLIRHDDGTLGHYCHLQKGGVYVKAGQIVQTGELIAHSGNTGFSSGAHLHFCVFKTLNGHERVSIPVQFRTSKAEALTLLSGRSYKAVALDKASPTPASTSEHASAARKSQT